MLTTFSTDNIRNHLHAHELVFTDCGDSFVFGVGATKTHPAVRFHLGVGGEQNEILMVVSRADELEFEINRKSLMGQLNESHMLAFAPTVYVADGPEGLRVAAEFRAPLLGEVNQETVDGLLDFAIGSSLAFWHWINERTRTNGELTESAAGLIDEITDFLEGAA